MAAFIQNSPKTTLMTLSTIFDLLIVLFLVYDGRVDLPTVWLTVNYPSVPIIRMEVNVAKGRADFRYEVLFNAEAASLVLDKELALCKVATDAGV